VRTRVRVSNKLQDKLNKYSKQRIDVKSIDNTPETSQIIGYNHRI
jgi:hypothetical protein